MSDTLSETHPRLASIGHSNQPLEQFLELLKAHRIEVLVDVRSQPYSKYAAQFNAEALKAAVLGAGMKYLYLGKELGGRPSGEAFYDAEGYVLYGQVAESALFLEGMRRLEQGARQYRVALMCSEEDPAGCHRRLLIGRVLAKRGMALDHIRGDGRVQTEAELVREEEEERRPHSGQLTFLEDAPEAKAWKSIRSVLPRGRRPSSSER
ncbi:MAG: DUF488 domain-containing protein [Chloroflexi bacterium]|nr:DUF488 domain-containing protein [Chloroflexota bacterium]